jgi:hypothetical protein
MLLLLLITTLLTRYWYTPRKQKRIALYFLKARSFIAAGATTALLAHTLSPYVTLHCVTNGRCQRPMPTVDAQRPLLNGRCSTATAAQRLLNG